MIDRIIQLIGLFFFGIAVWLITKEVDRVGFHHLVGLILSTPLWVIGLVVLFTGMDYIALSGYDILALRYIRKQIPYKKVLEASGIGFAVSNTTGHAYLAGGSIRYLFYTPEGLSKTDLVEFIAFESLTILIGMAAAFVLSVGLAPFEHTLDGYMYLNWLYAAAVGVVAAFAAYYFLLVVPGRHVTIGGTDIRAPERRMTVWQLIVGLADNICVFLAFYAIIRYHVEAPLLETFMIFIIAQTIGISTQVPGGVGVFEGLFLYLFPHEASEKGGILAGLAIFRVIYFFVPFLIASAYLGVRMMRQKWGGQV